MRKFFIAFLALVLIFTLLIAPVEAQDIPTDEPTPPVTTIVEPDAPDQTLVTDNPVEIIRDQNPILLAVLLIIAVLFALLTGGFIFLARQAYNALPPWAAELLMENRDYIEGRVASGFDFLDDAAAKTPNPLDDMLAKFGREQVEQWITTFYSPPSADKNSTPDG